jgi:carbon monoxide dehydrogenase subunit G
MVKERHSEALCRRHSVFVPREPGEVFALVDDVSSMHRWLDRCIRVQKYREGENAVGDPLRCVYQGVTRHGVLTGAIVARVPTQTLACTYAGRSMRVALDFSMSPRGEGTYLTHSVQVTPTGWLARLSSPLIHRMLERHMAGTMEGLRRCLLAAGENRPTLSPR